MAATLNFNRYIILDIPGNCFRSKKITFRSYVNAELRAIYWRLLPSRPPRPTRGWARKFHTDTHGLSSHRDSYALDSNYINLATVCLCALAALTSNRWQIYGMRASLVGNCGDCKEIRNV